MGDRWVKVKGLLKYHEFYICLIILAFGCIVQAVSGQFFTANMAVSLCRYMMLPLFFAVGEMLAMVSVGTDVSFPAIAALSSFITTAYFKSIQYSGPVIIVFLAAGIIGFILGMINGFIIAKWRFPTLIVTLGTSTFFIGILNGPLKASNISGIAPAMEQFGKKVLITTTSSVTGFQSKLPAAFLLVVVLYIAVYLIMKYTLAGRGIYAIGGSISSANNAGFHVNRLILGIFAVIGMLAGIGGALTTCTNYTFNSVDLIGTEMDIIAAVLLGGVKPGKGIGGLRNAVLGVMLLKMVQNNLLILGIPLYWQKAFTGIVIIVGMAISMRSIKEG